MFPSLSLGVFSKNVYSIDCGISTVVVHRLPKPRMRVQFPYAALIQGAVAQLVEASDLKSV